MTKKSNDSSGNKFVQFAIPALLGAGTAAAGFLAFLYFDANQTAPAPTTAQAPATTEAAGFSSAQKAEIEKTVESYLLNNPQILVQMSEALETHQREERMASVHETLRTSADKIFRSEDGLVGGNPDGDVTVVEFSDYNCQYCKRSFGAILKLIEKDPKVRVVMKEFPIFGERSESVARLAIAAAKQGKYFEMHQALLGNRGPNNEKVGLLIAERLGLDIEKLKADANSDETAKIITETRDIANQMHITGTPFYLVGDKVIPGAPSNLLEVFEENIALIRQDGCRIAC